MWRRIFPRRKAMITRARPVPEASPAPVPQPADPAAEDALPAPSLEQISEDFHRLVLDLPAALSNDLSPSESVMLKRMDRLAARFDLRSLPRLPSVLPQLLRTLKRDDAAGGELAKLIGRDPAMVGEVMRATSTVYYRSVQPIGSLRQAVVLLGQDGLRRVITQHVMKPILHTNAGTTGHAAGERLWEHAERCAHVCAWLGRHMGCETFEAYLAGIVRNAGTGAMVRLLDQLTLEQNSPPFSSSFIRSCVALANQLSLQAARQWALPPRVLQAMSECQHPISPATSALGRALSMADSIASARMLIEHERIAADTELGNHWPGITEPAVITRCQRDLERHFVFDTAEA
ncbi:MAG TPA: HDOD domain-containing protein [Rhodanobacter sp.]|nr:HDOD domain-containing protein [Rhodanobacter sp.]